MSHSYHLLQDPASLEKAMQGFAGASFLAMDLEGEFNLHRYGMHLCLIQVSDGQDIYLIDPIAIENLDPFFDLMEDPEIRKISHGPESDFLLIDRLYGRTPRNVFDTQKAATLLANETTSLAGLLKQHFDVDKDNKIREKDWSIRPITEIMLQYAAKDVAYLIPLYEKLRKQLMEADRLDWVEEECKGLEALRYEAHPNPHLKIKGAKRLSGREMNILKHLFAVREEIAKKIDKPAAYIIGNKLMLELAQHPLEEVEEWRKLRSVHPRTKHFAEKFMAAVESGRSEKLFPKKHKSEFNYRWEMRNNPVFKDSYFRRKGIFTMIKEKLERNYDIAAMILSQKNIHKMACGQSLNVLKKWQQKVVLETAASLEIPMEEFSQPLSQEVLNIG